MSRLTVLIVSLYFTASIRVSCTHVAIEQCPGTDVTRIRQQTQYYNEVSLIFYYTRWSADSLDALQEYSDVAAYYSDKIYFSAIDCWHLSCNCSRAITTTIGSGSPHKWPTLMAYYGRRGQLQIQYHGLWTFKDMQQFVANLLQPLERLQKVEEVNEIKSNSDAIIIGVFETPDCYEYKQYMMASLKWLESDPLRTYRFTVTFVKNNTANSILKDNVKIPNILFIGASEEIRKFSEVQDRIWNASNVLLWLHREFKVDLSRLHGYTTPITIAQKLKQTSVLAIFVNDPRRFFSYMEPYIYPDRPYSAIALQCSKLKEKTSLNGYFETQRLKRILENFEVYTDDSKCYYNVKDVVFKNLADYYEINAYLRYLAANLAYPDSLRGLENNINSNIRQLLNFYRVTNCLSSDDISTSNSLQLGVVKQFQGMLGNDQSFFKSNRSISVVLLDTERYKDYLQNLDIVPQRQSMATVFIIDTKQQSNFLMSDNFDLENLKDFIRHYYEQNLLPTFKNEKIPALCHNKRNTAISSEDSYELQNLNRFTFLNNLHYVHNQSLVLLIHSPECALCGTLQHTFIQVASALRHSAPELKFVRINAQLNDLPWQFNMASLPALLVFPKNHFDETRLFPSHLKPNFKNVFAFILEQLLPEDQMKTVVTFCQNQGLSSNHSQSCWRFAKTLLLKHIGKHLHYWQLFENERSLIFERLRAFKDMSLDVQRNLRL